LSFAFSIESIRFSVHGLFSAEKILDLAPSRSLATSKHMLSILSQIIPRLAGFFCQPEKITLRVLD